MSPPAFHSARRARRCGIAFGAVVVLMWAALMGRFVVHGPVTPEQLAWSVAGKTGSAGWLLGDTPTCTRESEHRWTCSVLDSGGSGDVPYAVVVRPGSSCWDARIAGTTGEVMPDRASGCVPLLTLVTLGLAGGDDGG